MQIEMDRSYVCRRGELTQCFSCRDLLSSDTVEFYQQALGEHVGLVYSDPPWNPGNEKYWRSHAEATPSQGYASFLAAWNQVVALCVDRGARDVLCEQSEIERHRKLFLDARNGWDLPLLEEWTVFYGSPGSRSCSRPNRLLHFGDRDLITDPAGMAGEPMTVRACAGLALPPGSVVCDPCLGKGMTSRMAHYFQWNLVGTEINPARLQKTLDWLLKQGYEVNL